jgi:hypothetical protein
VSSRSYEGIVPQITANIGLNNFTADSITGDKVFILALCVAASHFVSWKRCIPNGIPTGALGKYWDNYRSFGDLEMDLIGLYGSNTGGLQRDDDQEL